MRSSPIRALVLDDSADGGEVIANLLRTEPGLAVTVATVAFGEGLRTARRIEPDVIVLVADSLVGADTLITVEEVEAATSHAALIVLSASDPARLHDFVLAGARDCLAPPYTREVLVNSVRRIYQNESRRRERLAARISGGPLRHRCQVIAFHGAKGGVGTTTLAVNVAVALHKLTGERVVIVDASLQAGDVAVTLNLVGNAGLDDLLPHLNGLDLDLLDKVLVTHASGVRALLAPRDLERAEAIGADDLRRILAFLSGSFDYIVVDTPPIVDTPGLAALDHADQIVVVATPDVPALKNAGRFLQLTRRLGYSTEKVAVVVNRANSRHAIRLGEIAQHLGVKPIDSVPSADGVFLRAANSGEVVGGNPSLGGPGRALNRLALQLAVGYDGSQGSRLLRHLAGPGSIFRRRPRLAPGARPGSASLKADSPSS